MPARLRTRIVAGTAVALWMASAGTAAAQLATISGQVKSEGGQPIAGATVVAENPEVLPSRVETTTKDNGRFTLIGLRGGNWTVTCVAPGFLPFRTQLRATSKGGLPLVVTLQKATTAGEMAGLSEELRAALSSAASLHQSKQYAEALAAYESLHEKAPDVTAISLQIANIHREMKNYDRAIAVYDEMLAREPGNSEVSTQRALTYIAKGDLDAAEAALTQLADAGKASAESYYALGEVKFAKAQVDEAAAFYQKAASANPGWAKPLFKLGLVALNKGDKEAAKSYMQKVIDAEPNSAEAAQATAIIKGLSES